jgi:hypothetical protein
VNLLARAGDKDGIRTAQLKSSVCRTTGSCGSFACLPATAITWKQYAPRQAWPQHWVSCLREDVTERLRTGNTALSSPVCRFTHRRLVPVLRFACGPHPALEWREDRVRTWSGGRGRGSGGGGGPRRTVSRQQPHIGAPTAAMAHSAHRGCHGVRIGDMVLHEDGLLTQRLLCGVSVRRQFLHLVTRQLQQRLTVVRRTPRGEPRQPGLRVTGRGSGGDLREHTRRNSSTLQLILLAIARGLWPRQPSIVCSTSQFIRCQPQRT